MTDAIENRLARLEQTNRRWRAACGALLLLWPIGYVIAAQAAPSAPAEIVQARRIEVVDAQGHASIVLQNEKEGASLVVWGPDHQHAAVLVAQPRKAALMLMKGGDNPEVFAQAVDQGAQIGVTDGRPAGEAAALNITGGPTGLGIFQVAGGRTESGMTFTRLGSAIELRTPGGKAVTRVIGSDRGGHVEILDAAGQVVWSAPPGK